ncbi:hypothetical protein [Methylobacterium sp. CM6247]
MSDDSHMVFGMCPYDDLVQMAHRISQFQARPLGMRINEYYDYIDELGDWVNVEVGDGEDAFKWGRGSPKEALRDIETDVGLESIPTYFRTKRF